MKHLPTLALCLAGAAAGTALGWILRGPSARSTTPESDSRAAGADRSSSRPPRRGPGPPALAQDTHSDELSSELSRRTGAMRWIYLLGAADTASAQEMPRLLRAVGGDPILTQMLAVRWAQLDPRHMFETLSADAARSAAGRRAGDLSADYQVRKILFDEWVKSDREAAIAALSDRTALPGVDGMRHVLANSIMKSDPARGLKLMTEWNISNFIPDMAGLAKWAAQDPRAAAEAVTANALGHATSYAMERIGPAWAAVDPVGALAFAAETRGLPGIHLAQAVMTGWAQRDLNAALAHVGSQSDNLAKARLGLPLLEAWAKSDPQSALVWANENLQSEARAAAAASIVKSMAANDLGAAAEFIASLEPGGGKIRAIHQLVGSWLEKESKNDPGAALAWMASLPDPEDRRQALEQSAWRLFYQAPDETVSFLTSSAGVAAPQPLFERAAAYLAKKNPESAMEWAAALPDDRRSAAQQSVLAEWITARPDAAFEWVQQLPRGDLRTQSVTAATSQLVWQGADLARRWIESLPAADHPAALAGIRRTGQSSPHRADLEAMVK